VSTVIQTSIIGSSSIKRVTVNLPRALLKEAVAVTGGGTTDTIVQGLQLLARQRAHVKGMALKGKLDLRIDVDASRERDRR
jgi:hypothetical protein